MTFFSSKQIQYDIFLLLQILILLWSPVIYHIWKARHFSEFNFMYLNPNEMRQQKNDEIAWKSINLFVQHHHFSVFSYS